MEYSIKVVVKQGDMSEKEKADRVQQFSQAFVTAAVDYYTGRKSRVALDAR